jgi:hypothetical protein
MRPSLQAITLLLLVMVTALGADPAAAIDHKSRPHVRHHRLAAPTQPQIACTMVGCNPVPPGCHPEPQRYFSGMTTGYDAVVCP